MTFGSSIVNKLKSDNYIDYFKTTTYKELSSLFGKFVSVMDKTAVDIHKELTQPIVIQNTPQIEKTTQYIQLSLFDEFEITNPQGNENNNLHKEHTVSLQNKNDGEISKNKS